MDRKQELLNLLRQLQLQLDDEGNRLVRLPRELAREHERVLNELQKIRFRGRKVSESQAFPFTLSAVTFRVGGFRPHGCLESKRSRFPISPSRPILHARLRCLARCKASSWLPHQGMAGKREKKFLSPPLK